LTLRQALTAPWNHKASPTIADSGVGRGVAISNSLTVNVTGVAAALCSMASFVPQALKIIKARDAGSVSLQMYVVTVAGFTLWTAYGIGLKSCPLIASNTVSLLLSAIILGLKIWMPASPEADQERS
jgi:MtN3 and saliva related transmembrane protein